MSFKTNPFHEISSWSLQKTFPLSIFIQSLGLQPTAWILNPLYSDIQKQMLKKQLKYILTLEVDDNQT